ncbi:hypothetical protein QE439_000774 [Pedobacter agri]|nr:hypothetical protein [Pedobacter agri]
MVLESLNNYMSESILVLYGQKKARNNYVVSFSSFSYWIKSFFRDIVEEQFPNNP